MTEKKIVFQLTKFPTKIDKAADRKKSKIINVFVALKLNPN